jgi:hypothetical protein
MGELIPASNLPAVPASHAVVVPQDRAQKRSASVQQKVAKAIRRVVSDYALNTRWQEIAYLASQDASLAKYGAPVTFPVGYGQPLLGRTDYSPDSFDINGWWIYKRLHYLVVSVLGVLADTDASHPLGTARVSLEKYKDLLLWNAATDIILAQKIVTAEDYNTIRSRISPNLRPIAVDGVAELRNRVLYIIDALDLIYRLSLQCERFKRAQEQVIITSELEDALNWFQSFAEVAENMREPEETSKSILNIRFWRLGR